VLEFCYETLAEARRDRSLGDGVLLSTLHGAKGLEFRHVLIADGGWGRGGSFALGLGDGRDDQDEDGRRLFYVGMTRARETLSLGELGRGGNPHLALLEGDWLIRRPCTLDPPPAALLARRYTLLTPADLDLGYAGRHAHGHPIHARLAALAAGDALTARVEEERVLLCGSDGTPVARLSARTARAWLGRLSAPQAGVEAIRIVAMLQRRRTDGDPAYRDTCRCEVWELPLAELVWRADAGRSGAPTGPRGE
jgi:ATP-dependent DNA helicase RecQ